MTLAFHARAAAACLLVAAPGPGTRPGDAGPAPEAAPVEARDAAAPDPAPRAATRPPPPAVLMVPLGGLAFLPITVPTTVPRAGRPARPRPPRTGGDTAPPAAEPEAGR